MKFLSVIKEDRKFGFIDIFKFIMAFAVIAIHTNPVVNCTNLLLVKCVIIVEDWAVPFFFITAGFFLFYNMEIYSDLQIQRIDKYLKKIVMMYCVWTVISFPLTVYGYIQSNNSIIDCILSYVKYFLFVGKLYNSYHLWYLLALIYAVVIIRFMLKHKCRIIHVVLVAVLIYSINEILQYIISYSQSVTSITYKAAYLYQYVFNKGGVFCGMVYVVTGMLIANYKKYLNRWLSIILIVIINIIKLYSNQVLIEHLKILETTLVFMVIVSIEINDNIRFKLLRKSSTIIYLSHLIWYSVYTFAIIKTPNKLGADSFVVTSLLAFINAVTFIKLMQNDKMKWIRKIT